MNPRVLLRRMFPAFAILAGLLLMTSGMDAKTKDETKKGEKQEEKSEKDEGATLQRIPTGVYENMKNKVSNIEFYSSNWGIFGLNVQAGQAGGIWPRGSGQAYIFGGGLWFGAKKFVNDELVPMSVVSYNPNSGASWMVPGRITFPIDRSSVDESQEAINKYRMYLSTDYNNFTGEPLDKRDIQQNGPNWPIWDTNPTDTLKRGRYLGNYVDDITMRNRETYPKGPAIISEEDIFSTYKDTDLDRYELGRTRALEEGYPLGIQVEQTIYTWGFGRFKDFLFIRYLLTNMSEDTLYDCYMASVMDMDLGDHRNDRNRIVIENRDDDTLDLAVQWSEAEARNFGYIGFDFLESPAVDSKNFIRQDKPFYDNNEQIGLTTFQNWPISEDPLDPVERYLFISAGDRDADNGPGDKRFQMSTGPFNMRPGDTARIVIGLVFAPGRSDPPTGQWEDLDSLVSLDRFMQQVYDDNFLAPKAPDPATLSWSPLNEGVQLSWDDRSERSIDFKESGLDFAGYVIERTRKPVAGIDITNDTVVGWNLGWKEVARIALPTLPTVEQRVIAGRTGDYSVMGPWWRLPMLSDTVPGSQVRPEIVYAIDTIRKQGGGIELVQTTRPIDTIVVADFEFDPFDDRDDDSSHFNTGKWSQEPWGSRFRDKAIRDIVRDAIVEIMDSLTNGHTYIDVGDDNSDGTISENPVNLEQNEKLINNVDYYYRLLAYDQGDPEEGTESKSNSGIEGINETRATPEAPPASRPLVPETVLEQGMGGIRNFRIVPLDAERLGQLLGGDTVVFEFEPFTHYVPSDSVFFLPYWYSTKVVAKSKNTGNQIFEFILDYEQKFADRASNRPRNLDTAFVSRYVTFQVPDDTNPDTFKLDSNFVSKRDVRVPINGSFLGDPPRLQFGFGTIASYKNTFTVAFDYSFVQFGDSLRYGRFMDSASEFRPGTIEGSGQVPIFPGTQTLGTVELIGNPARITDIKNISSVGQAKVQVEFIDNGGRETITATDNQGNTVTFNDVPYYDVVVKNVAEYEREVIAEDGSVSSVPVTYDYEFYPQPNARTIADTLTTAQVQRSIEKGAFALYAFGWLDVDKASYNDRKSPFSRINYATQGNPPRPLGTPNRYYYGQHGSTDGSRTLRFTHQLVVNGADVIFDYAGMGGPFVSIRNNDRVAEQLPTTDFAAGDKVTIDFTGGTLGLPQPDARVEVAIPEVGVPLDEYTDDVLDAVRVVPNPYLVDHIGQQTTEKRVYFTRLPKECKIEIFTASGELLQTIDHMAAEEDGHVAVNIWQIITNGGRQAQSQLLVARITTPNGAETIKKFAVVVGGFRTLSR